jgi:sporadic carbohydrate cluster 2OG-Fe(II) oxygenase
MFLSKNEKKISTQYLKHGYVIQDIDDTKSLNWIRDYFAKIIIKSLPNLKKRKPDNILNNIHKFVKISDLNKFRLDIFNKINTNSNFRENFYKISKSLVDVIVGNEIAMQLRVNLSIQMPKDNSSLLPVHADTWSGVSPFETVVWLPLVDCYDTKSMYILPPDKNKNLNKLFLSKKIKKSEDVYKIIKKDLIWLNVKYGQIVIFDQSLPHGNRINKENETRWTMNCRFKSIFTPYADKKIGEFYEPITLKAASKRGITYKLPK